MDHASVAPNQMYYVLRLFIIVVLHSYVSNDMSQMIRIKDIYYSVSLIELNNRSFIQKGARGKCRAPCAPCLRLWLVCTNRVLLYYKLII